MAIAVKLGTAALKPFFSIPGLRNLPVY